MYPGLGQSSCDMTLLGSNWRGAVLGLRLACAEIVSRRCRYRSRCLVSGVSYRRARVRARLEAGTGDYERADGQGRAAPGAVRSPSGILRGPTSRRQTLAPTGSGLACEISQRCEMSGRLGTLEAANLWLVRGGG